MMTKEGSTKIVNFMTPGAGVLVQRHWPYKSYMENALFLAKFSSQLPGIHQSNQVCSNDDQGRVNQIGKYHDPWGKDSCARAWSYTCKSYSENALFLLESSSLLSGIDRTNQV